MELAWFGRATLAFAVLFSAPHALARGKPPCGPCCGKNPAAEARATQGVSAANPANPYVGKDRYTNVVIREGTLFYLACHRIAAGSRALQFADDLLELLQSCPIDAVANPLNVRRTFDQTCFFQDRNMLGDRRWRQGKYISQAPEVAFAMVDEVPQQLDAGRMRQGLAHERQIVDIDFSRTCAWSKRGAAGV